MGFDLGDLLVDRHVRFVAGRCRPATLRAVAFDSKTFFTVVDADPMPRASTRPRAVQREGTFHPKRAG